MRLAHDIDGTTLIDTGSGWHTTSTPAADIVAGHPPSLGEPRITPTFGVPIRPGTIHGIGLNFADTVAEMEWETPKAPYLFPKLVSSVVGPSDPIVVDLDVTTGVDWEGELGVVIGRTTKNISVDDALDAVFGYVAVNDVSARDLQARDGQWVRGKGLDTFCPLGPWILTADEVPDPQDVSIRTRVNGVTVQEGSTSTMIFTVADLVAYCSRWFTLSPGDLILTGTPAGCGGFQDPAIALHPGDLVEVDVTGLGRLCNPVVAPAHVRD